MIGKRKRSLSPSHLKQLSREIDPDEIFLDAENLPEFDKDQFEGRIEKPIGKGAILGVALAFLVIELVFVVRVFDLQVMRGEDFLKKSENNRLEHSPIFAMRGVISDRNKVPLAWNSFDENTVVRALATTTELSLPRRAYIDAEGFGHVLGYVSYPKRDSKGYYYQENFIGKDGLEETYNDALSGKNGVQIVETDALGNTQPGNTIEEPVNGAPLTLAIDARVQEKLYTTIRDLAADRGYMAGAGAIMDVKTGELIALTSFPEYTSSVLSNGTDKKLIQSYQLDKRGVFLDRAVTGLYTPGSIVKPFMGIAALNEGVITPEKQILSTGSISVPNPYYPNLKSVFNDWKAHGWVDLRHALAVSSDVYFYEVGGGYQDQKGIGIGNIEKYARMFGFGAPTGIDITDEKIGTIPSPEWKTKVFKGEPWRIGDTYHTVIGQYGFQVTILQAIRAVASIANNGTLLTPHIVIDPPRTFSSTEVAIPAGEFQVVREGMRLAVTEGTEKGLNVNYVEVAGKTGTAEIDSGKKYINSWVTGFFPYEKPRYAFAVVMERGPHANTIGGVFVMRQMFDWMHQNTPEYLKEE